MKNKLRNLSILLFLLPVTAWATEYFYRIPFKSVAGAMYYDVQLFDSETVELLNIKEPDNKQMALLSEKLNSDSETIAVEEPVAVIKRPENSDWPYSHFRLRTVDQNMLPGPWGQPAELEPFLVTVKTRKDNEPQVKIETDSEPEENFIEVAADYNKDDKRLYLAGSYFKVSKSADENVIYVKNYSDPQLAESDRIPFKSEGRHHLQLFRGSGRDIEKESYTFYVDRTAPVVQAGFKKSLLQKQGKTYVTPETMIAINARDYLSGIASLEYRIVCGDEKREFQAYSEPLQASALPDCTTALEAKAVDKAGNASELKSLPVRRLQNAVEE